MRTGGGRKIGKYCGRHVWKPPKQKEPHHRRTENGERERKEEGGNRLKETHGESDLCLGN